MEAVVFVAFSVNMHRKVTLMCNDQRIDRNNACLECDFFKHVAFTVEGHYKH